MNELLVPMKLKSLLLFTLTLLVMQHVWADDNTGFLPGWKAHNKGDYGQAAGRYGKDAEQGDAGAQYNLGVLYANGQGVPQDDKQAVYWYLKAAEQGDASAQNNLGSMYATGRGFPQDDMQAVSWYLKAAEQGDASAQNNLGSMYHAGKGIPQDDKQALIWYSKSAEQGYAPAQSNLGDMYQYARGVPRDKKQAMAWYLKAAKQGVVRAQLLVGLLYDEGKAPQDKKQAVVWYDFRGDRIELRALAELEELAQVVGALRLGALLLQRHLQRLQLLPERGVFLLDLLERDVAGPQAAHAVDHRHRAALDF